MNSILLTEDHKSKLLEMCEKLFPEYDFGLNKWNQPIISLGLKTKDLYENHIPWFEFCMIDLLKKLQNSLKTNNQNMQEQYLFNLEKYCFKSKGKHPIDYLYKKFKKLKL